MNLSYKFPWRNIKSTVKPVYKGHWRENIASALYKEVCYFEWIFFPYTVLPRFIAPLYNAKRAYHHDFLKSHFIYVIIPSHIAIRQTIFSTKVSKLIYFPSLIMPNCLITFIKIHNWFLFEPNKYTCHGTWFLCVYFVTWSYDVNPVIRVYLDRFCN